ncbi:hypothetical protein DFH06DRAFT_1278703 [Mycena polygramma]|nr:hypothetical protein DFH06DRAFT_1278703 [Mycena polygramma]
MSAALDDAEASSSVSGDSEEGGLATAEIFWRDHQVWLKDCGYMLRPRFRPDWVPSWRETGKDYEKCEDGEMISSPVITDATRIRDGADVCLKLIEMDLRPFEYRPRNHCVPILEALQIPEDDTLVIVVMPLLRKYSQPRFDTFDEAVDFFGQVFEGLKFMHDNNIAHRDCTGTNIMTDGSKMYPHGFHPQHPKRARDFYSGRAKFYTRTQRPPKYYFIDFGLSHRYETRKPPPLEAPILGGDKSVPEFRFAEDGSPPDPCDPFPTDVYYLGNMIRTDFIEGEGRRPKLYGFEFMKPLVDAMVAEDPAKRPTIDQVVERFVSIRSSLGFWKLRSHVVKARGFPRLSRPLKHWYLRVGHTLRRVPAIPSYQRSC